MKIIGNSKAIKTINTLIKQVANTQANVLIYGESGTGKELVAREIHAISNRKNRPFIPVNCAAIPSELLESELFGHEKGAFTGAMTLRQGRFELANGGSILLDEIGDMPLLMQAKLLRVLQEKSFERIGASKMIVTDVRVIAATNKQLEQSIQSGTFREDLYYRLNVFPICIPPLRERKEDIPELIEFFVQNFNQELQIKSSLAAASYEAFMQYDWPGNVRELGNVIERICILHPNKVIGVAELPEKFHDLGEYNANIANMSQTIIIKSPNLVEGFDLKEHLIEIEIKLIAEALQQTNGVVSRAARLLGLQRTTLIEKIKKYKLIKEHNL